MAAAGNDLIVLLAKTREPLLTAGAVLMPPRRAHARFVLIELVTTLVLMRMIGAFAGFFLGRHRRLPGLEAQLRVGADRPGCARPIAMSSACGITVDGQPLPC